MASQTDKDGNKFELVRGAHVEVKAVKSKTKKLTQAEITVNGEFVHRFPHRSRVSKHLELMPPKDLAHRLTGGNFFFINEQLHSFQDGHHTGFVHTDESIAKFMDLIGFQDRTSMPLHHSRKKRDGDQSEHVLRKIWHENEIQVPGYQSGGDFTSELSFVWNPFVKNINSQFDLVRLICTNGMVGLTSFLNTSVPIVNRWEEHLDIAARQIQNKVNGIVIARVGAMSTERASIADCLLLEQHAFDRLYAAGEKSEGERQRLLTLMAAVAPRAHLKDKYHDSVFLDRNLAAQVPAHLSNFDVFNVATELRTHTSQSKESSDNALDKFANGVLFERQSNFSIGKAAPRSASFSDPEQAFFGRMDSDD